VWTNYSDLPKDFSIANTATGEGCFDVWLYGPPHKLIMFDTFRLIREGFESDLYQSLPSEGRSPARYSTKSSLIDWFMDTCPDDVRPSTLIHSIIVDYSAVVEVLSEELPKLRSVSALPKPFKTST